MIEDKEKEEKIEDTMKKEIRKTLMILLMKDVVEEVSQFSWKITLQ